MEIRLCKEGTERDLTDDFCRKVFTPSSIEEESPIKAKNPYAKGDPPTAIAIHNGAIVGHQTTTPHALWVNGEERLAHWLSGLHVLPEARGKGVAKQLVACITDELTLASSVFVIEATLRIFKANNWVTPGKIVEYMHIANPKHFMSLMTVDRIERFLSANMRSTADVILRTLRKPAGLSMECFNRFWGVPVRAKHGESSPFVDVTDFGADVDELWDKTKESFNLTHVRNAEYMNWQFPTSQGWRKIVYHTSTGIKAWMLYTIVTYNDGGPLDGLKALNIIDAFWCSTEPDIVRNLIRHTLLRGYDEDVDIIMASGSNSRLRKALRAFAFFRIPSTVYVTFLNKNGSEDCTDLFSKSYITRGYADAAGGLAPQ